MQKKRTLRQAILAMSLVPALMIFPAFVYGQAETFDEPPSHMYDPAPGESVTPEPSPGEALTPAEQDLVERVRQRLGEDPTLATYAQSIEITAEQETIILRGMVNSEQEKAEIGNKVQETEGVSQVENELQVVETTARL